MIFEKIPFILFEYLPGRSSDLLVDDILDTDAWENVFDEHHELVHVHECQFAESVNSQRLN